MNNNRNTATAVGVLYIVGTVAGISSVMVTGGLFGGSDYLGQVATHSSQVQSGALLILVMGISLALIPALLFPILKQLNEPLAIGYVIFRGALETLCYIGMAICWLLLLVVAQQYADSGATASQFQGIGTLLLKANDPVISNVTSIFFSLGALMLYHLLYQARLIPRWISGWGTVAAVLTLIAGVAAVFSTNLDYLKFVMLPQEMVMAVWLIVKGFGLSTITPETPRRTAL